MKVKKSKQELKERVNELVQDNDTAILLLEDIEDSMIGGEIDPSKIDELQSQLEEMKTKYEELLQKYKDRFLKGSEEEPKKEEEATEEPKEETVIDVKEI